MIDYVAEEILSKVHTTHRYSKYVGIRIHAAYFQPETSLFYVDSSRV